MFALVNPETEQVLDLLSNEFSVPAPLIWVPYSGEATNAALLSFDGTNLVEVSAPMAPSRWPVLKSTIRLRLREVELEATADTVRATLPATAQAAWAECLYVLSDDPDMIAFLMAIEADPEVILAQDPEAARIFGHL
jgi:hypothetical protein